MEASTEAKRKGRYERVSPPQATHQLTPRQWRLLRWLADYRILTAPQLALLSGRTSHTVRQQLRGLFDANLIEVLPVSRAALARPEEPDDASLLYGSAPNVYIPTKRGLTLLLRHDLIDEFALQRPLYNFGPRSSTALAHTLFIRDVRIWLEVCASCSENDQKLLCWHDGGDAMLTLGKGEAARPLIPDAWFAYRIKEGSPPSTLVGLVECDRGTERGMVRWGEKLLGYSRLFAEDDLRRQTGYISARVLVFTPDAVRRDQLATLILEYDQEKRLSGQLARRFWLAERSMLSLGGLNCPTWRNSSTHALRSLL